jgi:hypothetical protein
MGIRDLLRRNIDIIEKGGKVPKNPPPPPVSQPEPPRPPAASEGSFLDPLVREGVFAAEEGVCSWCRLPKTLYKPVGVLFAVVHPSKRLPRCEDCILEDADACT